LCDDTKLFFKEVREGVYQLVLLDLTERELVNAPESVRNLLQQLNVDFELTKVTSEAIGLAKEYLNKKVVGKASFDDCVHIATATINKIDILVSCNFKHIVNIQRTRGYNAINSKNGYQTLEIRTPQTLIHYED